MDTLEPHPGSRVTLFLALPLFLIPFALFAAAYRTLPLQVPVMRISLTHWVLFAPKSPFIIFRIPLMNMIHGTMAALMLSYAPAFSNLERRANYSKMFATLLFTIGLKSLFEALEFTTMGVDARVQHWLALCTFVCVAGGVVLALWHGGQVRLPWPELRIPRKHKFGLAGLFGLYLLIAVGSLSLSHRLTIRM